MPELVQPDDKHGGKRFRCSGRAGDLCLSLLLETFLTPLEHIQFDENEGEQPKKRIPEVDEVAFDAPVDGRE
jgi:hypothetical protein